MYEKIYENSNYARNFLDAVKISKCNLQEMFILQAAASNFVTSWRRRQIDGQTDGRTTYDSNTALALRASRGKKSQIFHGSI